MKEPNESIFTLRDNPSHIESLSEDDFDILWQRLVDFRKELEELESKFLKAYIKRRVSTQERKEKGGESGV